MAFTTKLITVEAAEAEFEACLRDVRADFGDAAMDEAAPALLECLALDWPADVAREVCRMQLGFVPAGLSRLRPDIG